MSPALECLNLTKRYRGSRQAAVDGLNLRVESGQVFGFLGQNGAGKTTTIRMMLDLIRPSDGEVRILGQNVYRNPAALRAVGAFVEGASFYPYLSGWDNLRVFGRTLGSFDADRAKSLLEAVGLAEKTGERVGRYSTGMKQRLGIAAALLHNPPILILDEPSNGLDPRGMQRMRAFIRELADKEGKTVFLSSHLLTEVQQICDHVAIIDAGRLVVEGAVSDLLQQTQASRVILKANPLEKVESAIAGRWKRLPHEDESVFLLDTATEDIPALVRALVAAEADVYHIEPQHLNLEEVYFALTSREEQTL